MKRIITTIFIAIGFMSYAQEEQKTLFGSEVKSVRAYTSFNHKAVGLNNQIGLMAGGEISMVFNHKFNFGFFGYGMYNDVQSSFVDQNSNGYLYELGMGGMKLEPLFFSNSIIHFTVPVEVGVGGMSLNKKRLFYTEDDAWEESMQEHDVFTFVEPGIRAEVNLFKNLRLNAGVGYLFTDVMNISGAGKYPVNGLTGNVSLKLGWF